MLHVRSPLDQATEGFITEVIDCGFVIHRDIGPRFATFRMSVRRL
jgi:hypothetical protein